MTLPSLDSVLAALAGVSWTWLAIALAFHVVAIGARARAWQNVLQDDFPQARVRYRGVLGASAAGVGVNAVLPFRIGDPLKLFIAKREVAGSTYPALVTSLFVLALVDSVLALGYIAWATQAGTLPGFGVLFDNPGSVGSWMAEHPAAAVAVALVLAGVAFLLFRCACGAAQSIKAGLARGFAVLRDWPFFLRGVVTWIGFAWVLQLCSVWWFLRAFDVHASLPHAATVQAVQSLAVAVPVAPSGAGAEQALLLLAFDGVVAPAALMGFAVGMRAAVIVVSVAVGIAAVLLLLRTLRWRRLLHEEVELIEHVGQSLGRRLVRAGLRRPAPQPALVRIDEHPPRSS